VGLKVYNKGFRNLYFCLKHIRVEKVRRFRRRVDDVDSVDMTYVIDFEFEKHEEVSPKVIGKMWTRFQNMSPDVLRYIHPSCRPVSIVT